MVVNNHLAYKPRSASTITVQSGGILPARQLKSACQCGRHAPARVASTTCQATGMAQPRTTTLILRIVKRWPRVEASMASAMRGQVGSQQATTQRSSAAKQEVRSSVRRLSPRLEPALADASQYHSRSRTH